MRWTLTYQTKKLGHRLDHYLELFCSKSGVGLVVLDRWFEKQNGHQSKIKGTCTQTPSDQKIRYNALRKLRGSKNSGKLRKGRVSV